MRNRLVLLFLLALAAGSEVGAAANGLAVHVRVADGVLISIVRNEGMPDAEVSNGYLLSGRGGGNVLPILVSSFGQLIPPCSTTMPSEEFSGAKSLSSGKEVEIGRVGLKSLARLHCLDEGTYTLAVAYRAPSGSLYFSNQLTMVVMSDGSVSVKGSD